MNIVYGYWYKQNAPTQLAVRVHNSSNSFSFAPKNVYKLLNCSYWIEIFPQIVIPFENYLDYTIYVD